MTWNASFAWSVKNQAPMHVRNAEAPYTPAITTCYNHLAIPPQKRHH